MKRVYIILIAILTFTFAAKADATFTVNAPARVQAGSKFNVTFVLKNGEASEASLKAPQINGCKLLYGPSTSYMQSYQMINGRTTSTSSTEYTYIYRAEKEGSYTIGAATIVADGKKLSTKPATITIAPANNPAQGAANAAEDVSIDDIATQSNDKPINANDVFIRISTSRSSAYEQEAIECTIKLYTKYSISEFIPISQPTFNGFLVEDLQFQASLNARETYNGQEYRTAVIKKCILFPQKTGKQTIVSGSYDLTVVQYEQISMGFYQVAQPVTKRIRVNSNSASVEVLPLPSPRPAGFDGAVGHFSVDTRLSTESFRTNEPVTLSYTVSGSGNIKYVKEPDIDFPTEFEQYSPTHDVTAKVEGNNVTGKSKTEYTFVPKEVGNYTINVPDFVYFNPTTKSYEAIEGKTFNVKVAKGLSSPVADRQDIAAKNTDIIYIKTGDKDLSKEHHFFIAQPWYWITDVLLILALVGVLCYVSYRGKRSADVSRLKQSKASKVAKKRLHIAHKYMVSHDAEKFYDETDKAIWGYLSDKLSIPASQLFRPTIAETLQSRGVSEDVCNSIISVLDTCDMARYAPMDSQEQIETVYQNASDAINALEKAKITK